MIPNIRMLEQLVLERLQYLQREAEQKRMLAGLPRHRRLWPLLGRLGTRLVALGTRMQQREWRDQPSVCNGPREGVPWRKDRSMNPQIPAKAQRSVAAQGETEDSANDRLARCGCTAEEIMALLWLRHWYQSGGSDRIEIVRSFEFLKWLVMMGKLTV